MDKAKDLTSIFIKNFRQVDDHLLAGAQPQLPEGLEELQSRYGVKTIVKLNHEEIPMEDLTCRRLGMELFFIPMRSTEIMDCVPMDKVRKAEQIINDPSKQPVFIHCSRGSDRTGCVVAIHRIDNGWTADDAIAEMHEYRTRWFNLGFRHAVREYAEEKTEKEGR